MSNRYIKIILFVLVINSLNAQEPSLNQTLDSVFIKNEINRPYWMESVSGTVIYSGKKNETIQLSQTGANLVNNSARQIFAKVPGISVWENDGSGTQMNVAARGLSPNRSWEFNTRQNGYDISSDVFGYPEAYYNPPMEAVEKIQIIRGGASLQFGPQFGGLLNYILKRDYITKPIVFRSQNSIGSYGLFSTFNSVAGKFKKFDYKVYNHYRKGDGWRENGKYEVINTHAMVRYTISPFTSISAEYTNMGYKIQQSGGLTDKQFLEDSKQSFRSRNWFSTPWNLGSIHLESKINNWNTDLNIFGLIAQRNSIGFVAAANILDTINNLIGDYNPRQLDNDKYKNLGLEWRNNIKYDLGKQTQRLSFGLRAYQSDMNRRLKGKGDTGTDFNKDLQGLKYLTDLNFSTKNAALFLENQFQITDHFSVVPGLRFEYLQSKGSGRLNIVNNQEINSDLNTIERKVLLAGLGLEYKLNDMSFYANGSQAFRPVLFSELIPSATTDVIDPDLKDATGYNADLGFRGVLKNWITWDISAFYIQYNNKIGNISKYTNDDPSKSTYLFRTNLGQTNHKGIETFIELNISNIFNFPIKFGNLKAFTSMAFIDARYKDFKITTTAGSAPNTTINYTNLADKKVENAPSQIHLIGINYDLKGLSLTLQTKITSSVFSDANNTESPNSAATIGKINGYNLWDFSIKYRLNKRFDFQFNLNNIGNIKYATRRAGGYPGPGLIPGEGRTFNFGFGVEI